MKDPTEIDFCAKPKGKIIVADDQALNLQITKQILSEIGKIDNCSFLVNGQEAIDKVQAEVKQAVAKRQIGEMPIIEPVVLLILDLQMPIKTGFQVVVEVKKFYVEMQKKHSELTFIEPAFVFLTAFSSQALRMHLKKMQIKYCLEKPVGKDQLLAVIDEYVPN